MTRIVAQPAEQFLLQVRDAGLPEPEREYLFAKGIGRKWRFDFCWPEARLDVEIEGGVFTRGVGHTSVSGIMRDMAKINAAQVLGWRVLRFHARNIDDDEAIPMIRQILEGDTP